MKVLEKILDKWIRAVVNIDEMQFGFQPRKGTTDTILIWKQIQEKHLEKNRRLYMPRIYRSGEGLWSSVKRVGVQEREEERSPRKAGLSCEDNLWKYSDHHQDCTHKTEKFPVNVGFHQGSALSNVPSFHYYRWRPEYWVLRRTPVENPLCERCSPDSNIRARAAAETASLAVELGDEKVEDEYREDGCHVHNSNIFRHNPPPM